MFVGHYGVSFAAKRGDKTIPLWVLFLAVQLLDVFWSVFVLAGLEKVRIAPGITASNPLDLYYMPYTHSLVAALLWSLAAYVGYRAIRAFGASHRAALLAALAGFSHWVLALQAVVFFGPPPPSDRAAAITALGSYVVFAAVAGWLERRRV